MKKNGMCFAGCFILGVIIIIAGCRKQTTPTSSATPVNTPNIAETISAILSLTPLAGSPTVTPSATRTSISGITTAQQTQTAEVATQTAEALKTAGTSAQATATMQAQQTQTAVVATQTAVAKATQTSIAAAQATANARATQTSIAATLTATWQIVRTATYTYTATPIITPYISSLSPTTMTGSTSNQTLKIYGSNFVSGATLTFVDPVGNIFYSVSSKLTFNSSGEITYLINNNNAGGNWVVFITNPNGVTSNLAYFTVTSASTGTPVISGLEQSNYSTLCSGSTQHFVVYGSNFVSGDILYFINSSNSFENSSVVIDSTTQLTCQFDAQGYHGNWTVQVKNAVGDLSNAVSFNTKYGTISSISPSPISASSSAQTITINGNYFVNGASLVFYDPESNQYSSTASKLTFVSSNKIQYVFNNGNDIGTWYIAVQNPCDSFPGDFFAVTVN